MNDSELRQLLRQWRDIEPPGNFAANVHRRIRLATAKPAPAWWTNWLWQLGPAVAVAILIGATVGSQTMTRPDATGFLASDTLTGRYLELDGGAHR